eukprot:5111141-Ditylum_brightwellii.AAC.1
MALGRAVGWKRCWSQKSADHRGTPEFPGLVCTLLTDEEVRSIIAAEEKRKNGQMREHVGEEETAASMTEG